MDEFDGIKKKPTDKWIRKRKYTFIIFFIQNFFLGIEYSVFFLTSWLYITTLLQTDNPKLIYSLSSASYLLSCSTASIIIGRITDIYRHIWLPFVILNLLVIIGNLIYTIYYSPFFIIFGRFISGIGGSMKPVTFGEVGRCYIGRNLTTKFAYLSMAFSCGFILGPAANFLFVDVDFEVFGVRYTDANFVALFMSALFIVLHLIGLLFVTDLSKEYDLSAEYRKSKGNDNSNNISQSNSKAYTMLLSNTNIVSIYTASAVYCFLQTNFDMLLPIIILDTLKWSIFEVNIIICIEGITIAIAFLIFTSFSLSCKSYYYIFILSITFSIGIPISMVLANIFPQNLTLVIFILSYTIPAFCLSCIGSDTYLVIAASKLVSSNYQATTAAIRSSAERVGSFIALLTSAYLIDYLEIYSLIVGVIFLVLLIFMIVRNRHMASPKIEVY